MRYLSRATRLVLERPMGRGLGLLYFAASMQISCGLVSPPRGSEAGETPQGRYRKVLADPVCQSRRGSALPYYNSKAISEVVYGSLWSRRCQNLECRGEAGLLPYYLDRGSERPLRVCSESLSPGRGTVEAAAFEVVRAVEAAWQEASHLIGEDPIPRIKISIFPEYRTEKPGLENPQSADRRGEILTDEVLYFPESRTLAILPISEGLRDVGSPGPGEKIDGSRTKRWQMSFVLAHEYGHHLHRSLSPRADGAVSGTGATVGPNRQDRDLWIDNGVAEGIADLLGYYLLEDTRQLEQTACMGIDRNPTQSAFAVGVEKDLLTIFPRLDQSGVSTFDGGSPESEPYSCLEDLPPARYALGAAVAYRLDQALETRLRHVKGRPRSSSRVSADPLSAQAQAQELRRAKLRGLLKWLMDGTVEGTVKGLLSPFLEQDDRK